MINSVCFSREWCHLLLRRDVFREEIWNLKSGNCAVIIHVNSNACQVVMLYRKKYTNNLQRLIYSLIRHFSLSFNIFNNKTFIYLDMPKITHLSFLRHIWVVMFYADILFPKFIKSFFLLKGPSNFPAIFKLTINSYIFKNSWHTIDVNVIPVKHSNTSMLGTYTLPESSTRQWIQHVVETHIRSVLKFNKHLSGKIYVKCQCSRFSILMRFLFTTDRTISLIHATTLDALTILKKIITD